MQRQNTQLQKQCKTKIESNNIENLSNTDEDSDCFSETDEHDNVAGNSDTFLNQYDCSTYLSVIPGENQTPISIFQDPDSEFLAFPTIYCGQKRPANDERMKTVSYSDICKVEISIS